VTNGLLSTVAKLVGMIGGSKDDRPALLVSRAPDGVSCSTFAHFPTLLPFRMCLDEDFPRIHRQENEYCIRTGLSEFGYTTTSVEIGILIPVTRTSGRRLRAFDTNAAPSAAAPNIKTARQESNLGFEHGVIVIGQQDSRLIQERQYATQATWEVPRVFPR